MSATPAYPSSNERTNYAKLCRAIIDLGTDVLRDVLYTIVQPGQIKTKIKTSQELMSHPPRGLESQQKTKVNNVGTMGSYKDFDITLLCKLLRYLWPVNDPINFAAPANGWGASVLPDPSDDSYGDDIERLRIIRNTIYGHVADTKVSDSDFLDSWKILEGLMMRFDTRLNVKRYELDLSEIKNMCMDDKVKELYIKKTVECTLQGKRIKETTSIISDNLKLTGSRFIKTRAYSLVMENLNKNGCAVIKGNPGDGKTILALHCMKEIVKNGLGNNSNPWKPIQIYKAAEWEMVQEHNMIIFIDDMFGSYSVSWNDISEWKDVLPRIISTTNITKENRNLLLVVVKNDIYERCPSPAKYKDLFSDKNIIELGNPDNKLTDEEIERFISNYTPEDLPRFDIKELRIIKDHKLPLGLPQTCNLFLTNEDLHHWRTEFFLHPVEFLRKEFHSRMELGRMSYAVLVLIFLHGGQICKDDMSDLFENKDVRKRIKQVSKICQIPIEDRNGTAFLKSAKTLLGSFVIQKDSCNSYAFLHSSIQDAIGLELAELYPMACIQNSSVHLLSRVYIEDQHQPKRSYSFPISKYLFKDLSNKILHELEAYSIESWTIVASSPIWESNEFNETFENLLKKTTKKIFKTNSGDKPFVVFAAQANSIRLVKTLYDADVFSKSEYYLALNASANIGHEQIADYFLDQGVLPDITTCFECIRGNCFSVFERILNNPALKIDVRKTCKSKYFDIGGTTILHEACELDRLKFVTYILQRYPLLIRCKDNLGFTVLHSAAFGGNLDIIKTLVEHEEGSKYVYERSRDGTTILHQICCSRNIEALEYLKKRYPDLVNEKDSNGEGLMHWAARYGSLELFFLLENNFESSDLLSVAYKNKQGSNILHCACQAGNLKLVEYLVESKQLLPEERDNDGYSPLHYACKGNTWDVLSQTKFGEDKNVVQYLISKGVEVSQTTNENQTIFHVACLNGNLELIRHLYEEYPKLKKKGEVNENNSDLLFAKDNRNWNVLHYAAKGGYISLFKYFVASGMDVLELTNQNETVLHIACAFSRFDMCEYLIDLYNDLLTIKMLDGSLALHAAARGGDVRIVQMLIEKGDDIFSTTYTQQTILHLASMANQVQMCEFLLQKYPDLLPIKDINEWTFLHYAVYGDDQYIIEMAIEKSKNIYSQTSHHASILHLGCLRNNTGLCKRLVEKYPKFLLGQDTCNMSLENITYVSQSRSLKIQTLLIDKIIYDFQIPFRQETALRILNAKSKNVILDYLNGDNFYQSTIKVPDEHLFFEYLDQDGSSWIRYVDIWNVSDINKIKGGGVGMLHSACLQGKLAICKYLVDKYPTMLSIKDNSSRNILMYACAGGNCELVEYLTEKEDVYHIDKHGDTCLSFAVTKNHQNVVTYLAHAYPDLLNIRDSSGLSVLHKAADLYVDIPVINALITAGMDVYEVDGVGRTILHLACLDNCKRICKYLLEEYPDLVDIRCTVGATALHCASVGGDVKLCKLLIEEYEKCAYYKNGFGETILHTACLYPIYKPRPQFIDPLSGNPDNNQRRGITALEKVKVIQYIAERFPDFLNMKSNFECNAIHNAAVTDINFVKVLIDKKAAVFDKTKLGENILHLAVLFNKEETVKYLVREYPELMKDKTLDRCSVFEYARLRNNFSVLQILEDAYNEYSTRGVITS